MLDAIARAVSDYNPDSHEGDVELRFLSAPVFGADGRVAFTLTLWGPPGTVGPAGVAERVDALLAATSAATVSIGGTPRTPVPALA